MVPFEAVLVDAAVVEAAVLLLVLLVLPELALAVPLVVELLASAAMAERKLCTNATNACPGLSAPVVPLVPLAEVLLLAAGVMPLCDRACPMAPKNSCGLMFVLLPVLPDAPCRSCCRFCRKPLKLVPEVETPLADSTLLKSCCRAVKAVLSLLLEELLPAEPLEDNCEIKLSRPLTSSLPKLPPGAAVPLVPLVLPVLATEDWPLLELLPDDCPPACACSAA